MATIDEVIADVREYHIKYTTVTKDGPGDYCYTHYGYEVWPCEAVQLADEVERLRVEMAEVVSQRNSAWRQRDEERRAKIGNWDALVVSSERSVRAEEKLNRVKAFRDKCWGEMQRRKILQMHGPHIDAQTVTEHLDAALAELVTTEEHKPCCSGCGGTGYTAAAQCWDCRGSGCAHA